MDCYLQNGHTLKEFVEDTLVEEIFKQLFWSGIDNILGQMLLVREDHHPFTEFVSYALKV